MDGVELRAAKQLLEMLRAKARYETIKRPGCPSSRSLEVGGKFKVQRNTQVIVLDKVAG